MSDPTSKSRARSRIDVFRDFPETSKAIGALHETIMRRESPFTLGERLKPVLRFVARLTREPARTGAADTDAIIAAGWDNRAIFDVVCVCSFYNFMKRYVDGTGLAAAPDQLRVMGRQLAANSD